MDIKQKTLKSIKTISILAIVISTILFVIAIYSRPLTLNGIDTSLKLQGYIDDKVYRLLDENDTKGVSVVLYEEGKVSFINSYGQVEGEEGLITEETQFSVGGVSDSITALAVMKLVQEGQVELDQPVEMYIKDKEELDRKIIKREVTIRQLLNHTSGLKVRDRNRGAERKEYEAISSVGSSYTYFEDGSYILQRVIEDITDEDFEEYIEDIFKGMNMEDTIIQKDKEFKENKGDDDLEDGLILKTTPKDIGNMLEEILEVENVYEHTTIEEMSHLQYITNSARYLLSNTIGGYGLGFRVEPIFFSDSDICMYIGKESDEWKNIIAFDLENDSGIAILTNEGNGYKVCSEILDYYTDYQFNGTSFTSMYNTRLKKFWKQYVGVVIVASGGIIYVRIKSRKRRKR